jgi:hypothetical protein
MAAIAFLFCGKGVMAGASFFDRHRIRSGELTPSPNRHEDEKATQTKTERKDFSL